MYNSLTWSIPSYTWNPALISNSISAAIPLAFRYAGYPLRILLGYEWLGTIASQTSSPRGF